jgi:hypothetical protein
MGHRENCLPFSLDDGGDIAGEVLGGDERAKPIIDQSVTGVEAMQEGQMGGHWLTAESEQGVGHSGAGDRVSAGDLPEGGTAEKGEVDRFQGKSALGEVVNRLGLIAWAVATEKAPVALHRAVSGGGVPAEADAPMRGRMGVSGAVGMGTGERMGHRILRVRTVWGGRECSFPS